MKKRSRGYIALVMAVMMSTGVLLTACGSKDAGTPKAPVTDKKEGDTGAEVSDEPFALSIMTYDFGGETMEGEHADTVMTMIEEHTNTSLDIQFVPGDNYDDKLSITLASGEDMPHIIAVGSLSPNIINAAKSGALWSFDEYIYDEEAYPNLSQSNKGINESILIDGKLYGAYRARILGRNGMGYRDDWAENLGLGKPETIDDVYEMLYQFTHGDPDGNGKDDTYGLNLCKHDGPFDIMQTWFGAGNGWVEKDGKLIPTHQTDEYLESLNWFKKLYDEGLIASDFAVRDTATWPDDNKNGKAGVYVDVIDGSRRIWDYFVDNDMDASMDLVGAIAKNENSEPMTMATSGYNGMYIITKAAKTEEELQKCLAFLDKMNDTEMLLLADHGLEGIHYNFDEDGYLVDVEMDAAIAKGNGGVNQLVSYVPNVKPTDIKFKYTDRVELQNEIYEDNENYVVFNPATPYLLNSNTYTLNGANLDTIVRDARIQYIVGQIDEAGLRKTWDEWAEKGGNDIIEEVNAQL